MPWYDRKCSGCGTDVAARTNDPAIKVMCTTCMPGDLPFEPGQPENVGVEVHYVHDGDQVHGGDAIGPQ